MIINSKIQSPCIHVCTKDENGMCLGCFRTMDEIRAWYKLDDPEKLKVIDDSDKRRLKFGSKNPYL